MGFNNAMKDLLRHEGGYVNDPRDAGGETICGISRKWYPRWEGWGKVDAGARADDKELQADVKAFYYAYYWMKLKLDMVEDEQLAECIFNFSVNMGKKTVLRKVQRIVRVKQDGFIGQNTLAAIDAHDPEKLFYHLLLEVIEFYVQLGKKQPHYLQGWLNRATTVYYSQQRVEGY